MLVCLSRCVCVCVSFKVCDCVFVVFSNGVLERCCRLLEIKVYFFARKVSL